MNALDFPYSLPSSNSRAPDAPFPPSHLSLSHLLPASPLSPPICHLLYPISLGHPPSLLCLLCLLWPMNALDARPSSLVFPSHLLSSIFSAQGAPVPRSHLLHFTSASSRGGGAMLRTCYNRSYDDFMGERYSLSSSENQLTNQSPLEPDRISLRS